MTQPSTPPPPSSAFAPLGNPVFRWLWISALVSNTGTWVRDVGAGWLMTELDPSPWMVSLVSAAATLPILFLSIPAGALADVVDRRRLLLATHIGMMLLAASLAASVAFSAISPAVLLLITLGLGVGGALTNPAWQTAMVDLVPREQLPAAAALNSVSLNLSRALGPAIGGVLVAYAGPKAAFALNAVSFIGIIAVLALWRYRAPQRAAPGERFLGALKAGLRYVRHSPPMHSVLVRTASFVLPATSIWALMPLVARQHLGLGPAGFGLMLGALGLGAVLTTLVLPRVRAAVSPNRLIVAATVVFAAMLAVIALTHSSTAGLVAMLAIGAAWVTMVVTFNVAAQSGSPPWVRGRALSTYLAVFFGSMAIGGAAWGAAAAKLGIPASLLVASGILILGLFTLVRFRLTLPTDSDLDRSVHWEDPVVAHPIDPDDGPVAVTIAYEIDESDAVAFREAMQPVSTTRYRDGAISWILLRSTEDPRRWLEIFMVESWAEHLRQHDRVLRADKPIQDRAKAFHRGQSKPLVSHYIATQTPRPAPSSAPPSA